MSQGPIYLPVTGVYGGLAAANYINAATASLNTCWLGSSAPSIPADSIPAAGQGWIDTSTAGYYFIKRYDGSAWMVEGVIDTANDLFLNPIGGGTANIASAATCDLGTKPEASLTVTGTTTITSFGATVPKGQVKLLTFGGTLSITYNATSMILPGAASITTAAGDCAIMLSLGSGNWKCLYYGKISGAQLSMTGAAGTVASATTTDLTLAGSNAVIISGTTTITGFGSNATLANPYYFVRFTGALIITHNGTSLIVPGAQNITTAAGDCMIVEYLGTGNWRINQYMRQDGRSISIAGLETNLASASTTNLGSVNTNTVNITGTTGITSFGSSASTANPFYFIKFAGILTITYNATSMILPGAANITTAAGDTALVQYLGSGNWKMWFYGGASSTTITSINGGQVGGFRNKIYNGNMLIWQRTTASTALTTTASYLTADRWASQMTTAAAGTMQQNTSVPASLGFQYSMRIGRNAGSTSTNQIYLVQALETVNSIPLQGQQVTISFYVKAGANYSGASSQLAAYLWSGTGTDQSAQNLISGSWTGQTLQINYAPSLTTSWQRFQQTVTLPSNVTQLGIDFHYAGVGTAGADDNFYITGVQLEPGSTATPFEHRGFTPELSLCQRYYCKTFNYSVAPAQNAGRLGSICGTGIGGGGNTQWMWRFPVSMRTSSQTITTYNPNAANANVRDYTAGSDVAVSVDPKTTKGTDSITIGSLISGQDVGGIQATADAEL